MSHEQIRAEWERVKAQFEIRQEAWHRMVNRHEQERRMLADDIIAAGSAMDAFLREHPEFKEPMP